MKRFISAVLALVLAAGLAGCAASTGIPDPSATMESEWMPLEPGAAVQTRQSYTLYFSMTAVGYLSPETRLITVDQPGRIEDALVTALLKGPSATQASLTAAINPATKVTAVTESRDNLYITFSREFLEPVMPVMDASVTPEKSLEIKNALLRLAVYSVVNTVTELGRYTRVQILIDKDGTGEGQRPTRSELGFSLAEDPDGNQLMNPLPRNMEVVYSPLVSGKTIMDAMLEQDWAAVENGIAVNDVQTGQSRVQKGEVINQLTRVDPSLMSYTLRSCSYSADGQVALVLVDVQPAAKGSAYTDIPLRFVREDGLWRLTFASLELLLNHVE